MESLYKRYGAGSDGPGNLQASQTATANSFKEVLASVGGLQKMAENAYIADNTSKLQEHLKSTIRSAGLGADAPDMDTISRQFGKLIDTNALGQTINSTREKMVGEAKSSAEQEAGKVFGETDDLVSAGHAFKNKLVEHGMKDSLAADEEIKWRGANKFRAEDVANHNQLAVDNFTNQVLDVTRSFGGGAGGGLDRPDASPETIINTMADGLPTKIRGKAIDAARAMITERSKLTGEQQALFDTHSKLVTNKLAAFDREHALRSAAAQAEVDKWGGFLNPVVKEKAKAFADTPGGIGDHISEDASNWLTGAFKLDGKEVTSFIMPAVRDMIDKDNIPAADAQAIGLQAYQDAKADGGQALFGSGASIVKETLAQRLTTYRDKYINFQAAKRAQSGLLANGETVRAQLQNEGDTVLSEIKRGEGLSNVSGAAYDSTARFKKSIFSPDYVPPPPAPGTILPGEVTHTPSSVSLGSTKTTPVTKTPAEVIVRVDGKGKLNGFGPKEQPLREAAKQPETTPVAEESKGWFGGKISFNDPEKEIKKMLPPEKLTELANGVSEGAAFKIQIGDRVVSGKKTNGKLVYKNVTRISKDDADLIKNKVDKLKKEMR